LSSGPRAGLAEITLPAVQPGSSIMPGKVNPSVPEMVNQVCYQVYGCDAAILAAADAGQLELNVMMPVIAWNALQATRILRQAMRVLQTRTVAGIDADVERCRELLDRSTAVATALSPYIGYAATADIAKASVRLERPVRELVRERQLIPDDRLDAILSAEQMTSPGVPGRKEGSRRAQSKASVGGGAAVPAGGRSRGTRRAPARKVVSAARTGDARGAGPRHVAAARARDGRPRNRRGQRRR
jgi:aspartate ammonia-lyase